MTDEAKNQSCCTTQSCCCPGKKVFIGLLAGILLFSAGFGVANLIHCQGKVCPVAQAK